MGEGAMKDDGVAQLVHLMRTEPRHREVYVRLLELCKERKALAEVEQAVQALPQYGLAAQSPYRLVRTLVEAGGLDWIELDDDGVEVTQERKQGLTADEADDLVASFAVQTTAAGADAAEKMSPAARFEELVADQPTRSQAFEEVLAFCEEPRCFADVEGHLEACGVLGNLRAENGQPLQASYFVDMLERAGVLVWDGAWRTSADGLKALESFDLRAAV